MIRPRAATGSDSSTASPSTSHTRIDQVGHHARVVRARRDQIAGLERAPAIDDADGRMLFGEPLDDCS